MKKITLVAILIGIMLSNCTDRSRSTEAELRAFDLQDVRLLDSPFRQAQELDRQYLLALEADRLLAPFRREAGLPAKAEPYTNWENTGLDGHIGGHYLSALAMMYASTGDETIRARLHYMLSDLQACQVASGNGYIGGVPGGKAMWEEIATGKINAGAFSLNEKWVPLYNIHKTFAGLRDAYLYGESDLAKEMLIKMTDWAVKLVSELNPEQIQDMLRSEHGGLNETFADVAAITGDQQYLQLARQFSDQSLLTPLLKGEDQLTGMHANTQIPKVIGYERIAAITGDTSWKRAASFFWQKVVDKRSVCIGGNSAYEHFHPADDFSKMIQGTQGPETCNTYNMLRLTKMLYLDGADGHYMDFYERALYNHILSSQHPETGGLVYFTQMRPGHFRVYSQPQTSFWCCVGSGIENHAKYGEMIYAHTDDALYVNLFIPSRLSWEAMGVEVIQENNFPEEAATRLTINTGEKTTFDLNIRDPGWVGEGGMRISINGEPYEDYSQQGTYVSIHRAWEKGDQVEVSLPMALHTAQMPDGSNYYAFLYGPIVLAARLAGDGMSGLFADDSRGGHIAQGTILPLTEIPMVVGEAGKLLERVQPVANKPLRFSLQGLHPASYQGGLELMPFYQLHESRYVIYFPQASQEELQQIKEELEAKEASARALDKITADLVVCGEQQPESDHFIQLEDTWTGYMYEHHWREGPGYFSYQMRNKGLKSRYLYLKYLDIDQNRKCDIYLNDQQIGDLQVNGTSDTALNTLVLKIPDTLLAEKELEIKVAAKDKFWMMKMAEVRLLEELPES